MKIAVFLAITAFTAAAQTPTAKLANLSRPDSSDFQVGDRYQVVVTGAPNLPVSVRTMRQGRTDWGPVIGYTDAVGRYAVEGQFEKQDFGDWREIWTAGGRVASPVVELSVKGQCLPGGHALMNVSGPNVGLSCDTSIGPQSFVTPSDGDSFRTPDGRVIEGHQRSAMTAEDLRTEVVAHAITGEGNVRQSKMLSAAISSISQIVGANALSEKETRNVIAIAHAAFEGQYRAMKAKPELIAFLQHLEKQTDQLALQQQLADTVAFVEAQ